MASDIVVALKDASANGTTHFGVNHYASSSQRHCIQRVLGQMHDPGELAHASVLALPQARQTYSVLGVQAAGEWGYLYGVNEYRVAIGVTEWNRERRQAAPALDGPDLVRLALERSHGALQAVEILTDLLEHHGQAHADGSPHGLNDHIYLIADANEAFVLETAGRFWALLECGPMRVVTDAAMIRQDWRRLAPGLASHVIKAGRWQDDGSKLDFVGCVGESSEKSVNAQKRWGRASLALAQQQGAIDLHYLRHMLAEHYSQNREILSASKSATLASSFLIELPQNDQPILAWVSLGSPRVALYFPLCLIGELPGRFAEGSDPAQSIQQRTIELEKLAQGRDRAKIASALERLQAKFDQDADDFLAKSHELGYHGKPMMLRQLATEMMHHHVELFDAEYRRLLGIEEHKPHRIPASEEVLFFA